MRFLSARGVASPLLLLLVALLAPSALGAPLVEHFTAGDGEAYVEAAVRALGDADSSLVDKDYAVRLLGALGKPSVASGYKSSACSVVAAALGGGGGGGGGDLEQIHHGISLGNGVGGCANAKTWAASEEVADAMKVRRRLAVFVCVCVCLSLFVVRYGSRGSCWLCCCDCCAEDRSNRQRSPERKGCSMRESILIVHASCASWCRSVPEILLLHRRVSRSRKSCNAFFPQKTVRWLVPFFVL